MDDVRWKSLHRQETIQCIPCCLFFPALTLFGAYINTFWSFLRFTFSLEYFFSFSYCLANHLHCSIQHHHWHLPLPSPSLPLGWDISDVVLVVFYYRRVITTSPYPWKLCWASKACRIDPFNKWRVPSHSICVLEDAQSWWQVVCSYSSHVVS